MKWKWKWHFHELLCEEMIFPLPSGKKDAMEISFLHTKVCGNSPFHQIKNQRI